MRQKHLGLLPPERKPSAGHNHWHGQGTLSNYGNRMKTAAPVLPGSPLGYADKNRKHPHISDAIIAEAAEEEEKRGTFAENA